MIREKTGNASPPRRAQRSDSVTVDSLIHLCAFHLPSPRLASGRGVSRYAILH